MQSQLQHVIKQKVIAEWLFHSLVILQAVCSLTITLGLGTRAWDHLTLLFKKKNTKQKTRPFVTNITTPSLPNKLQPSLKKVYTPTYFLTFFLFPSRALKDAAQMKVELDDLHAQISIVNKNKVHGMGSFLFSAVLSFLFITFLLFLQWNITAQFYSLSLMFLNFS